MDKYSMRLIAAVCFLFAVFFAACGSEERPADTKAGYLVNFTLDMDQRKPAYTTSYWSDFAYREISFSIPEGDSVISKPFNGLISGDIKIVKLGEKQFQFTFTNTTWGNNSTVTQTVGGGYTFGQFTTGTYSDGRIRIAAQIPAQ